MATLLKMIVEKYDLHEVKKLVEDTEVAIWAECKKDMAEEKKEHLDEKLFEI
jgi:ribosomal protein L7/L12